MIRLNKHSGYEIVFDFNLELTMFSAVSPYIYSRRKNEGYISKRTQEVKCLFLTISHMFG